jgi:hypothetical protein
VPFVYLVDSATLVVSNSCSKPLLLEPESHIEEWLLHGKLG